ncbi:MAG TPA: MFS transporter [Candidatus Binataceae bacterium]|jgi:sugar phosphate permease|nr:MFS transporter [Candidatus Binataceae bacterium]
MATTYSEQGPPTLAGTAAKASLYPLAILFLIQAVDQMNRFLPAALFPALKRQFSLSDFRLGTLSSAFVFVAALGAVPCGILVDRHSRVRIAALGDLAASIAMIASGLANSFAMLFGSQMFLGSAQSSYWPSAFSLIADYYPVSERGRMLAIFQVGAIAGFLGLPIGAFISETCGWRVAFHFFAIFGFILSMLAWRLPEPVRGLQDLEGAATGHPAAASALARIPSARAFALVLRIPSVLISVLAGGLSNFFLSGLGTWAITFLVRYHHLSLTAASLTTSLLGIGAIVGALSGGFAGDRLVAEGLDAGRYYIAGIAYILAFALLFPAFAVGSTRLMIVLFAIGAVTLTMPGPQLSAILADVVHPDLRGRASAATSLVSALSTAASPLTFGFLSDRIGLRGAFLVLIPLMAIGGVFLLILGPSYLTADIEGMRRQLSDADAFAPAPTAELQEAGSDRLNPSLPDSLQAPAKGPTGAGILFNLLCLLGILSALALGIAEARR